MHKVTLYIEGPAEQVLYYNVYRSFQNMKSGQVFDQIKQQELLLTHMLPFSDKNNKSKIFDDAERKQLLGLEKRKVWTPVKAPELPDHANVITRRFLCAIKNVGAPEEVPKAKFVAKEHLDKGKQFSVRSTATAKQTSTAIMFHIQHHGFQTLVSRCDLSLYTVRLTVLEMSIGNHSKN